MVDDIILKHRQFAEYPIIYLSNSSIEEMCIAYKGKYIVSNISELLKEKTFSLPIFSNNALIIIDARLNNNELASINSDIGKKTLLSSQFN